MPDRLTPDLRQVLADAQTIAVVGCSDRPDRTSYRIAQYLQEAGYRMIPVNPHHEEVLGERCYPTLPDVPEDLTIDIVNVFRHPRFTALMLRHTVARMEQTGERPTVWTQLGVSSPEAEQIAAEADLPYIRNRCILVEHARFF